MLLHEINEKIKTLNKVKDVDLIIELTKLRNVEINKIEKQVNKELIAIQMIVNNDLSGLI